MAGKTQARTTAVASVQVHMVGLTAPAASPSTAQTLVVVSKAPTRVHVSEWDSGQVGQQCRDMSYGRRDLWEEEKHSLPKSRGNTEGVGGEGGPRHWLGAGVTAFVLRVLKERGDTKQKP